MTAARSSPRPVLLAVLGLFLAALAVDFAVWSWATGRMADTLADWEAARLEEGVRITHADPVRTGWPFAAELVLPHTAATATAPAAADTLSWQADQVTLTLSPWRPGTLAITASPAQSVARGNDPPMKLTAGRLELLVPLSGAAATADGHGLRIDLPDGPLAVTQADARFDATHLTLTLAGVTLPMPNLPFGGSVAAVALDGSSSVPMLPARDLRATVAAWRDAGGRLLLDHAAIHWGPLDAEGSGVLSLDAALQPVAHASLHLTGYAELIDALTRSGAITRNDARVAATLLGLLARAPAGAAPFVDLPLTLQDGLLAMGAIPLARVPRLLIP